MLAAFDFNTGAIPAQLREPLHPKFFNKPDNLKQNYVTQN